MFCYFILQSEQKLTGPHKKMESSDKDNLIDLLKQQLMEMKLENKQVCVVSEKREENTFM